MSQSKLKLALLSSQLKWGGGEQLLFTLGNELERRGHEVLWVCPEESVLTQRLDAAGKERFPFHGRHPSPAAMYRLRRQWQQRHLDVLHGNDAHAISWCGLSTLGWPNRRSRIIGVKHTVFPMRTATRYHWLVDRMVCVSQAVRRVCLDSGLLSDYLRVVYGGVEVPAWDRLAQRQLACQQLQLDHQTPLICAVGSLIPCKGYDILLEAAFHLRRHREDFCLVICGEGPMRAELESKIRDHHLEKQVRLLGFCEDPSRWIAAADLFVHPSRSEGLSLVTIAAQMLETPVVATDVGGLQEVMRCRWTSRPLGWILATHQPTDLAELIQDAIDNQPKRRQLMREARQSASERFSLASMVDGFLDVYHEALHAAQHPAGRVAVSYAQAG